MGEKVFDEKQYVVFRLGAEIFGVDISKVREIIVYREPTRMPGTSELVEGVINLRGHVIPIYSLRKKFGFPEAEKTRNTRMVVVEVQDSTIGIVVDGVSEVLMISGSVMEKPSAMISTGVDTNYIAGIAKMEEGMIIVLDLDKVINPNMAKAV
ncbi:MAG: chemotaxis protein CheW [Bacillota bacterium]